MNISYRWLRELAPTIQESPRQLADRLGMLGAPVEELVEFGVPLGDVVIARVDEVRPHPNADRLRVCTVDAGGGPLQVVCGAPNVEAGGFYPFAPVGATLPGGVEIRRAKIRGEPSEGMLCSPRELGLGRDHSGLLALMGEWEPGSSFVDQVGLDDARLVLDVTANRPDLLSHLGVAREIAPGGVADLRVVPFTATGSALQMAEGKREAVSGVIRVSIEDAQDCPRYMAAVLEGVRVAPSPEWLAMRLRVVGIRPINNIVDATNYVLHELGQPLHAFDLDQLAGPEIKVRRARPGEWIRTLDGVTRLLESTAIVIADRDRAVALAGIMGGEDSEVSRATSRILLECALFDPRVVRKTARSLGLSTDASHRFERGVDPEEQPRALARVVELILVLARGRVVGPVLDVHPVAAPRRRLAVRPHRVKQLLGVALRGEQIRSLLEPIGFSADLTGGALSVVVPPYRPDITREIDVIEEVARRHGYDNFDAELRHFRPGTVPPDWLVGAQEAIHQFFVGWGFREARTAAFAPAADGRIALLNPLSAEESHLRDDLTTGLLRRIEHNWAHGVRSIRLYEIGSVFVPSGAPMPHESVRLSAVMTGARRPMHWSDPAAVWDVWDLKGLMTELGEVLGAAIGTSHTAEDADHNAFARTGPGNMALDEVERFALRTLAGNVIGTGGRVRQSALDAPPWADPVWAVEVLLSPGGRRPQRTFQPLATFPPVERDLALVVPNAVEAAQVEAVIRSRSGDLLEEAWPFDLYSGAGIPENTRSIAWRLRFRHPERTLTDAEVDEAVANTLRRLEEELGAHRR